MENNGPMGGHNWICFQPIKDKDEYCVGRSLYKYDIYNNSFTEINKFENKTMVYLSTYANPLYSTSDLRQIRYTIHPT